MRKPGLMPIEIEIEVKIKRENAQMNEEDFI
jgi:hypothetical protein